MDRLHELHAMFGAGQRATAAVEELFGFLGEILPLMEEIDGSLRESTGRMPLATTQLQNVTEANEVATTEILDLVEGARRRLDALADYAAGEAPAGEAAAERLRALLDAHLADPAARAEAERLLDAAHRAPASNAPCMPTLDEARDHLNRILIALQVQDITAQQIAAVSHLIGSIQTRLKALIYKLTAEEGTLDADGVAPVNADTFNAAARYDRSGQAQALADDVMAGRTPPEGDGPSSPFDIDALFSAPAPGAGEAASQSDIDALFGGA